MNGETVLLVSLAHMVVLGTLASIRDIREYRIPDAVTFGSWGIGLIWNSILGMGFVLSYLGGTLVAIGIFLIPAWLFPRQLGWGDVKLAGAIGALCGPIRWIIAHTVAVGLALVFLLLFRTRSERHDPVQFAPFLAIGGVVALIPIWSELL